MATLGNFGGFRDLHKENGGVAVSPMEQGALSQGGNMTKRGKVLRDASAGPGLLAVDGQHYQFSLQGVWRSNVPPTAGMTVDVEFGSDAAIVGITQVADSQIAKEQAEAVVK